MGSARVGSIRELFSRRDVLFNLVMRDLEVKYKGSVIGIFWSLLNPLVMLVIYTIVFRFIVRIGVRDFPIFFMCGFLPWNFLCASVVSAAPSIINSPNLVRKVYMPRAIIPLSAMVACLVEFVLTVVLLMVALPFFGYGLGASSLMLPVVILLQAVMVGGLCLFFSASCVHFRDVKHLLEILLIVWFWLTPIVYPLDRVASMSFGSVWLSKALGGVIRFNPMSVFVGCYRSVLLKGAMPSGLDFALMFFLALAIGGVGWAVFSRASLRFAEVV